MDICPYAVATVLPGQLPVCCLIPVNALNIVLLPVFGLPANAIIAEVLVCSMSGIILIILLPID